MNDLDKNPGKAIRLSKVSEDGWIVSNDTRFSVRRYHWELPYKSISYRLFKDGIYTKGQEFDTLADLKDYLVDAEIIK